MKKAKLIVVLGPTACGKTKLAAELAAKFNGEIVSADSRQVYRGMDIGTGKDLDDYIVRSIKSKVHKVESQKEIATPPGAARSDKNVRVPYHLIDVVSPQTVFHAAKYQKMAYSAIDDILNREKTPFLVGGTGLYIDAVVKGYCFLKNQENKKTKNQVIRKRLDKLSLDQLLVRLKKIDPATYKIIDQKNRRRVQRALEIYEETGQPKSARKPNQKPPYEILFLGVNYPLAEIYRRIDDRLEKRIKEGMIDEVKRLKKQGVSWKRLESFGLEYRRTAQYLHQKISRAELIDYLKNDIHHFAKRQMTWFRRNKNVIWLKHEKEAENLVKKFLRAKS